MCSLLLQAVKELHDLRVVHYDVKVNNFCLRRKANGANEVVLLDFKNMEHIYSELPKLRLQALPVKVLLT